MSPPITVLQISTTEQEEQKFSKEGYTKVPGNLNSGTQGSDEFLWYKRGSDKPITRIQFSFRPDMEGALSAAGFTKINKNINTGTTGDPIYMWYIKGTTKYDFSIMDLKVTTIVNDEPGLFLSGWERLGCDLNRNSDGAPVYLWLKRSEPTHISKIQGTVGFSGDTALFEQGYFRVDEDTNRGAQPAGFPVFLWFQHSKEKEGVTELKVSLNEEDEKNLKSEGFIKVDTNLNEGTSAEPEYLWYKKGAAATVQYFTVLAGDEACGTYTAANCKVLEKNLNTGNDGVSLYIAFN